MGDINLLVINPGSTSTKIAIYENGKELYRKNLTHSAETIAQYPKIVESGAGFEKQRWRNF